MSNNNSDNPRPSLNSPSLNKILSVGQTVLAVLREIGEGTVKAFFPHPYSHLFCERRSPRYIRSEFSRLQKRGLISKKGSIFYLTKTGEKEAFFARLNAELFAYRPQKQKWDGMWRMILFDIPEKKRRYRDHLRHLLRALDFVELQKSIWASPYKIPKFLEEILWEERIKHHTRFITVKEIDYDKDLKKKFEL